MFKKLLIASAILACGAGAQAASFGISGEVIPGPCTLTLGGGGIGNAGALSKATVQTYVVSGATSGAQYGYPTPVKIPLSVTCSSSTRFELAFTDNKAGAKATVDGYDFWRGGISDGAGSAGIGAYNFSMVDVLADGAAPAGYLDAPIGTTGWESSSPYINMTGFAKGFKKTAGATIPDQLSTLTANLQAGILINKAYVDAASGVITLNGGGTVVLQYQ